jgi:hypothetical protein
MTDESEDCGRDSSSDAGSLASSDLALDVDVSGILAAQRVAEEAIRPAAIQSMIEVQKAMEKAIQPTLVRDLARMQEMMEDVVRPALVRDMIPIQKATEQMVNPAFAQSIVQTQKIAESAIQPAMFQSIVELQNTLDSALVQLDAPSITADVSWISKTAHQTSTSHTRTQTVDHNDYPKTDIDEIWPPESRIHDKLVWEDGEWNRRRTRELSFHLVDFIFWKAKQTGDLTDASDEEISMGATAAAFVITLALTGNPVASMTVAGATGGTIFTASKAAQKRSERRELDGKFDSNDE